MDMIQVDSSNIAGIGYDESSNTLQVWFNNGTSYQYFDVPERVFEEMKNAESKGKFLASHIKGSFRYSRV